MQNEEGNISIIAMDQWSMDKPKTDADQQNIRKVSSRIYKPRRISKSDARKSVMPEKEQHIARSCYAFPNSVFDSDEPDIESGFVKDHSDNSHRNSLDSGGYEYIFRANSRIPKNNKCTSCIQSVQNGVERFWSRNGGIIQLIIKILLFFAFNAYVGYVIYLDWERAKVLFILLVIIYTGVFYFNVVKVIAKPCCRTLCSGTETNGVLRNLKTIFKWILYLGILAAIITIPMLQVATTPEQLISGGGLMCFILITFIFSKHPAQVKWRTVFWGVALQFFFGLIILRWEIGKSVFKWMGDQVNEFLNFTDAGARFVYGDDYLRHQLAFYVLSVVIFFSFCTSLAYYWGVVPFLVKNIGWLLQITMATTAAESMNAAANIFVGMTEAPLLIRPHLPIMTKSEIHAVMTGGFATIAGSVMAAYIAYGVSASHLLSASVMSAPAALAVSKLFYPETEESKTTVDNIKIDKGTERNALEAAVKGASNAIPLVANIGANLIAFISFVKGINVILGWLGSLAGFNELSFEWICSYVFMPFAFIMGIQWDECSRVAQLIGKKTIINEFVAYKEFADMKLEKPFTERSEVITTYVLCGFSNLSSVGITLGALSAMAPERSSDMADIAFRALIAGCITCFMTGCIAGLIIEESSSSFTNISTTVY